MWRETLRLIARPVKYIVPTNEELSWKTSRCTYARRKVSRATSRGQVPEGNVLRPLQEAPGPRSFPLIGTSWTYWPIVGHYDVNRALEDSKKKYKKYGKLVKEEPIPGVIICNIYDPEDFRTVFQHEGKYPFRPNMDPLKKYREAKGVSVGMAVLQGEEWHNFRKPVQKLLLRPDFINTYLPGQRPVAEELLSYIRDTRDQNGYLNDCSKHMSLYGLEASGVICLNSRLGALEAGQQSHNIALKFVDSIIQTHNDLYKLMVGLPLYKMFDTPLYKRFKEDADFIGKFIEGYIDDAFEKDRTKTSTKDDSLDLSVLNSLVADTALSKADVVVMIHDLMATVDQVGNAILFNLYHLARNPESQERLHEEIIRCVGARNPVTHQNIAEMTYLRAVFKESARLTPVSGPTVRILDKEIELAGYRVPAGTVIMCHLSMSGQLAEFCKDPDKFLPERWIRGDDHGADIHPYCHLPFGHGPRICIGRRFSELLIYLGLIKIVQNFRCEYHQEEIRLTSSIFNSPDKPVQLRFIDR